MKHKINRSWRRWKNDDTRSRRAVVGSEGGPVKITAPRSTDDITSGKRVKRNLAPAKINATSDKIYDAGKELYNNNEIVNAKNLQQNQKPTYARHVVDKYLEGLHEGAN